MYLSQHLSDPTERLLYEKRILNKDGTDNFYPLDEGIRKMQRGLFALHMETPIGYRLVSRYFNEHEKCDLREIRYAEFTSPYFVSRKHSAFKEILRIVWVMANLGLIIINPRLLWWSTLCCDWFR